MSGTKKLAKYLVITFSITWSMWWGEAALVRFTSLKENDIVPMILFTVGGFGPTIASLFCLNGRVSVKSICSFIFNSKAKSFLILALFLVLEVATFGLSSMEYNPNISAAMIPVILLQTIVMYGGNEEMGWRGVMQPHLQNKLPYPVATFIVGVVWAFWHMPLWFIDGNSHQGSSFVIFALLAILLCYWLSAIVNGGGSIFYCMIMHGATNTLLSIFIIKLNWMLIAGVVILTVLAITVTTKYMKMHALTKLST